MDEAPAKLGNEPGIRLAPVVQQHLLNKICFAGVQGYLTVDICSIARAATACLYEEDILDLMLLKGRAWQHCRVLQG